MTDAEREEMLRKMISSTGEYDGPMPDYDVVDEASWRDTHPVFLKCGSDKYYAHLASDIFKRLMRLPQSNTLPQGWAFEVAVGVAAYLEDLVSGIGVWSAFRNLHHKLTGRLLPFYDCTHGDYYDDDLNIEDVRYIVWQAVSRTGQNDVSFFSPLAKGNEVVADVVFDMLVDAFDKAPVATRVRDYIRKAFKSGDYFLIRNLCQWIERGNPLTAAPGELESQREEMEDVMINGSSIDYVPADKMAYQIECNAIWKNCGPMGCLSSRYVAEIAAAMGFPEIADNLEKVEVRTYTLYEIEGWNSDTTILRDIKGEAFEISTESIGAGKIEKECKGYLGGLVRFGDLWYLNGFGSFYPDSPFVRGKSVPTMMKGKDAYVEKIVKRHRGRRIFYLRGKEELEQLLQLPDANQNEKSDAQDNLLEGKDNLLVFLSEDAGVVMMPDMCGSFKDPKNPFYDRAHAEKYALFDIMRCAIPEDIAKIVEKKKLLADARMPLREGRRIGKTMIQDNLRFLLGFYRTQVPEE